MTEDYELHRLVIKNLTILESAPMIVSDIEKIVFNEVDKIIQDWVEGQDGWEGSYDYLGDETVFNPTSWNYSDSDETVPFFYMSYEGTYDLSYSISALLGITPLIFGFFLSIDSGIITKLKGRSAKPAWRKYLSEQFSKSSLEKEGFSLHEGKLFLPIRIDAGFLAEDYPNNLKDSLKPISDALSAIERAFPEISAILKVAKERQF